jgi:hypothetical protein
MKDKKPRLTGGKKEDKKMSRKEALKKGGLIALSAATMLILLNEPARAQDTSTSPDDPDNWDE